MNLDRGRPLSRSSPGPRRSRPDSDRDSTPERSYRRSPEPCNPKTRKGRIFGGSRRGRAIGRSLQALGHLEDVDLSSLSLDDELETRGTSGREIPIKTNCFQITKNSGWTLYQYRVEFRPEVDLLFKRKAMIKAHRPLIGPYIFDGVKLFTARRIPGDVLAVDALEAAFILNPTDESPIRMYLRCLGPVDIGNPIYIQFYNVMVRMCLRRMGLEEVGRNYFDHNMAIDFPALRIQLWPGYLTAMRNHENDVLLTVEVTHKTVRTDDVLSVIRDIKQSGRHRDVQAAILDALKDTIVITVYNKTTYKIRGVDFNLSPRSTFPTKDGEVTYLSYYLSKRKIAIKDPEQPLLLAKQTKYDPRNKGKDEGLVYLVPELCLFIGLTEAMRSNFSVMKELSKYLHMPPAGRVKAIEAFMQRLLAVPDLPTELQEFGFTFQSQLLTVPGRVLPKENIIFANGTEAPNDQADWTNAFRSKKLLTTKPLNRWLIIVTKRDAEGVDNLVRTMQKVSTPLGFDIARPFEVITLQDVKTQTYVRTIDQVVKEKREGLQLMFIILPNNGAELYNAVKKRLVTDYGIPSQCFLAKNLKSKGLMSIATKLCVQMSTKLGGEPWTVKIPLKSLMVVGFNTYGLKSPQHSAMVASLSPTFAKYYSTISISNSKSEKESNMCTELAKCLQMYKAHNLQLPDWVLLYHDDVVDDGAALADGPEVKALETVLKEAYDAEDLEAPKFTYIQLSKKTSTRLMADLGRGRVDNVPPGTILDHTITLPERYDFFMVSATARQGTATPCCYNVVRDTSRIDPDKLHLLTFKLCHMYFNWSGTVAFPAPCQYAQKLAQLSATSYEKQAKDNLAELLYYL